MEVKSDLLKGLEYDDCICFRKEKRKDQKPLEVQEEMGEA
jgi:hypothetical protein